MLCASVPVDQFHEALATLTRVILAENKLKSIKTRGGVFSIIVVNH